MIEEHYYLNEAKYKVSGDELTLIVDGEEMTVNYAINGDVLTMTLGDQTVTGKRITEDEYKELIKKAE